MAITLVEAKAFLIDRHRASLGDLAVHFDSSPEAARLVMQHWLDKGRARLLDVGKCKGGCNCASRPEEVYEWVAAPNK
jgi:putative ferrous iron transport protein C